MKVVGCVFLILGSFMGAGFVSGREVAEYFARFGVFSYPAIVLAGLLLFFLIYLFLQLSSKVNSFIDFSRMYFSRFSFLINILFAMCLLIITGAMFAGIQEVSSVLGINKYLILIVTSILCYYAVLGNSYRLKQINLVIVPIMLIIILTLCLCNSKGDILGSNSICASLISASSYVFINIVTLGAFILEIGKDYTQKQKILISLITSIIITISLVIISTAISCSNMICSAMPILSMSTNLGIFSKIFAFCIWIGIFTTLLSNVFVLSGYLNTIINNKSLCIILTIIFSVVLGFVGFNFIIKYIYLMIAIVGIVITFVVCKKEIENGCSILKVTI